MDAHTKENALIVLGGLHASIWAYAGADPFVAFAITAGAAIAQVTVKRVFNFPE